CTCEIQLLCLLFILKRRQTTRSYRRVVKNMIVALVAATVLLAILFYVAPPLSLGRGIFIVMMAFVSGVVPCWRLLVAWSAGHPQFGVHERVLILGSGTQAVE